MDNISGGQVHNRKLSEGKKGQSSDINVLIKATEMK